MIATPALLSIQQRRVRQLEDGHASSPYRVRALVDVIGALDVDRLRAALQHVVPHAAVEVADAPPRPRRAAPRRAAIDAESWIQETLDRRAVDEEGAGIASVVCRLGATRALWGIHASAAVADEAAMRVIVERTVAVYRDGIAAADDRSSGLSYADYVDWQQELLVDPAAADARAHWTGRPCPDASAFRLPFAREDRTPREFNPGWLARSLDVDAAAAAAKIAAAARVEVSAALLAAWQLLLWRHLDGARAPVGVYLSGRAHAELRHVLGPCARYVPVDVELTPRSSIAAVARLAASALREHAVWQDCWSWDALDRSALPSLELAYHAFGYDWQLGRVQVIGGRRAAGPSFRLTSLSATIDRFDVRLSARRAGRRIECRFEWNRLLYDEADVAGLAERYRALLLDAGSHPDARLADLEIVGAAERDGLRARGKGLETSAVPDRVIQASFHDQVAIDPTRTAAVCGAARLGYGDLQRRARSLAVRLRAAGLAPGGRAAICLPRTIDQFVAMLGILECGATFVPLDPAVPWDRLAWMVDDSAASILIVPPGAAAAVPPQARLTLVTPDEAQGSGADDAVPPRVDPASPAYVIYTSGSTGRPKGVAVSHRNLVHSTRARRIHYCRPPGTYLLVSPMAFDSSMAGIFWTLGAGGTLVVPADGEHNDPVALCRLIGQHEVTHLLCLPSLYAWLLDPEHVRALGSLQVVVVAGDVCPTALVERHRRLLPGVELHSEYGPTETSIWCTVYETGTGDERVRVPIGRPIAGAEIYVGDRPWRLAPSRLAGEALVGGAGVSDGYLNRPDLTAERFVPDPWSGRPGARLYRTGDRVRWLASGDLDFLGRVDRQVKVRGYRVELEEIEAAVGAHADVRECAVAVRGSQPGAETLVAYVVPDVADEAATLPDRLRRFLGERMPSYMVPAAIVALDALPKTPNGKVDRERLPDSALVARVVVDPPSTPTEIAVAAVWQPLLGRDQIGIHDNFFELGGHSLMAITIHSQMRARLAPSMRLVDLFEHPTVHALAAFVDRLQAAGSADQPASPAAVAVAAGVDGGDATVVDDVVDDVRARQQALRRKRLGARAS